MGKRKAIEKYQNYPNVNIGKVIRENFNSTLNA